MEIESAPQKNIPFTWVGAGIKYNSVIHMHDEQKNFGWIGTTLGAQAIHNWFLTEQGVTTKVVVEESLEGLLVGIFKSSFRKTLLKGMVESLKELKVACEKAL